MQVALEHERGYVLRFDAGEEVVAGLEEFSEEVGITAAHFTAIGAANEILLSYYDLTQKAYLDELIEDYMEIVSLTGTISLKDSEPFAHAHGCFSDASMYTRAGHVKRCIVSATCEVTLTVLEGTLERAPDDYTGLDLLT